MNDESPPSDRELGFRPLALAVTLVAAGLALLAPLSMFHGVPHDAPFTFTLTSLLLGLLALGWRRSSRKSAGYAAAALLILALPLTVHVGLALLLDSQWLRARWLERSIQILDLQERPIRWPGIAGPVGLTLDIQLTHALGDGGILYPPKVRIGDSAIPGASHYFGYDPSASLSNAQDYELDRPMPPSPAHLLYDLYPPNVDRVSTGEWICLHTSDPRYAVPERNDGKHLGAKWPLARATAGSVDLSAALTRALRKTSRLEGRPDAWWALMERLTPSALEEAGYRPCQPRRGAGITEKCYCVPS